MSDLLFDKSKTVSITSNGEIKIGDKYVDKIMVAKIDTQENLVRTQDQEFAFENDEYEIADEKDYAISQGYIEETPFKEPSGALSVRPRAPPGTDRVIR